MQLVINSPGSYLRKKEGNFLKKSLVFDRIEMSRHLVDETVVYMFSQRKVKKEYFFAQIKDLKLVKNGFQKIKITLSVSGDIKRVR